LEKNYLAFVFICKFIFLPYTDNPHAKDVLLLKEEQTESKIVVWNICVSYRGLDSFYSSLLRLPLKAAYSPNHLSRRKM